MPVDLAVGVVQLIPSARGIGDSIFKAMVGPVGDAAQKAGEEAGKKLSGGLLANVSDTGKKLIAALGLAAVGAFAIKSAIDVEDAQNIIIRSTGATGKALDGLQESFRNIASSSGASFETIATTLSELSQNTGLTGTALETLTSQVIAFNRITKDSPITVDLLTHALAGFNIPAGEMGKVLDEIFKISQKTGVPLAEILATMQTAGPIARQFGFSIEFTATLLAQLNKAGLDANQILPGLRSAFVNFAKDGREPAVALRETLDAIDALIKKGDDAGARQLAVQIFGARGAGLVDAAIQGKLSLDDLGTSISLMGAGILDTAGKTGTLAGALGILRNNLKLALAEFAKPVIDAANEALRAVLPTIKEIGKEFAALPDGVKLGAASIIGLISLLGPLGNFGQGIQGLGSVTKALSDGFTLAAVKGLEMADSIKAISLASVASAAAIALPLAAILALGFALDQGVRKKFEDAARAGDEWARKTVRVASVSGDTSKTLANLRDRAADLKAQFDKNIAQNGASVEALLRYKAAHDVLAAAQKGAKVELSAEDEAAQRTAKSLRDYNKEVAGGGSATGAFADLTDDAKRAILEFQGALLGAAGGEIGREQQLINLEKAQEDVTEKVLARLDAESKLHDAQAIFGPDSQEAIDAATNLTKAQRDERQANLDLRQAQLQGAQSADDLDAANNTLFVGILKGTIAYDAQRQRLLDLIAAHPENAAGYQVEIEKLDAAKRAVDGLDGFIAHAKLEVEIANFDQIVATAQLLNFLNSQPGGSGATFDPLGFLVPHAAGGIFTKPHVGLFAEAGDEAVLPLNNPARSFQILGATGLLGAQTSVAQPSGPTVHIENWHSSGSTVQDAFTLAKKYRVATLVGL